MRTTLSLCMMLALGLATPLAFTGCDRYEHESTKTTTDANGNVKKETKTEAVDQNGNVTEHKTEKTVTNNP